MAYWLAHRRATGRRERRLPGGGRLLLDFAVPYEAMVWARQEEEAEVRALDRLLVPGDHFVDCGAGIGLWALSAAAAVGETGRVTAFEPNPQTCRRLRDNLAASAAIGGRVIVVPMAVLDARGELTFEAGAHHNLSHVVATSGDFQAPAVTLDEYIGDGRVAGIKLDVEGCEAAALRGAARLLARDRPWVCAELNTAFLASSRVDDWDVYRQLVALGYACHDVVGAGGSVPGAVVPAGTRVDGYRNLLFVPEGQ